MLSLLLWQCVMMMNSQLYAFMSPDKPQTIDIEPLIIDIRVPDIETCQQIINDDCKNLIDQMLKCEQIIFNDPGFSYQQYRRNINIHKEILVKYQSICEDVHSDYLIFDFKKD